MEVTNVQVISKSIVKPSSSSSRDFHHLLNVKLSLFDQLAPPVYINCILFYQAPPDHHNQDQILQNLKRSLSNTLSHFYLLAGKLDTSDYTVDCNDDGVELVEARVHATLSDVIQGDNMERLAQYLPRDITNGFDETLLAVQVSFFECGGFAVGICLSHRVADGTSMMEFLNAWAAASRGVLNNIDDAQPPRVAASTVGYDLRSRHFTARDLSSSLIMPLSIVLAQEKVVTKRFIFDGEKLEALRQAATMPPCGGLDGDDVVKDPTRVELVTAFIWKSILEIARLKGSSKSTFVATHAVNLRPRTEPRPSPLEHAFGNYYALAVAVAVRPQEDGGGVPELHEILRVLRNGIRKIDGEYTSDHGDRCLEDYAKLNELISKEETDLCCFTSWCRFKLYEVDFGWGSPVWCGITTPPMPNVALFINTKRGHGVEVLVNLLGDYTERFEARFKLLKTSN